jgi:hypothetical protein
MNLDSLFPISLVVGIVYAIKVVVETRGRRDLLTAADGSADLARTLLGDQERHRRLSSLRWGIVLVALALGFGLIEWLGWNEVSPGLVAVLTGATGVGNLVFFAITRGKGTA